MKKAITNRRILIVGEGRETEYNDFVGFRNAMEDELEDTATSIQIARGKGGNADGIVRNAIKEAKKFKPDPGRGDRVFLVMDTEGPGRAPELPSAEKKARENRIDIVYSCPCFEFWILCHFEKPPGHYFNDCTRVICDLNKKWTRVSKSAYDKADKDIFERLHCSLELACEQALDRNLKHSRTPGSNASHPNPSTQIHELIALLIGVRGGQKCPVSGSWTTVSGPAQTTRTERGKTLPSSDGGSGRWRLLS